MTTKSKDKDRFDQREYVLNEAMNGLKDFLEDGGNVTEFNDAVRERFMGTKLEAPLLRCFNWAVSMGLRDQDLGSVLRHRLRKQLRGGAIT